MPAPPRRVRTTKPTRKIGGVDLEVAGQAPGDAGDHAVGAAALEAAEICGFSGVCRFAHGVRMASRLARDHPE